MYRLILRCLLFAVSVFIFAAPHPAFSADDVSARALYVKRAWLPLAIPDPHAAPGSLFSITQRGDLAYVASLSDCNIPSTLESLLASVDATANVESKGGISYDPKAVLRLLGVAPGPNFSQIGSVILVQDVHGAILLDAVKVHLWMTDPSHSISSGCKKILNRPDVVIAEQAYAIDKGKFILKDQKGVSIDLRTASPPPLRISSRKDVGISENGELTFEQRVYTAIRHLSPARHNPLTLGTTNETPPRVDEFVSKAMSASNDVQVQPSVVYNAVLAPTVPNSKTDIVDAVPATVSFFIGAPSAQNAIDAKNWTVNPRLLEDNSNLPLIVTMTCTFCKDNIVLKQPLTFFGSTGSSNAAVFTFVPQRAKIKDPDGNAQIDCRITKDNIEVDYVVVAVRVVLPGTTQPSQPVNEAPPQPANLRTPPWARPSDLVISIRSGVGDRLEVSFQPGTPEVSALFNEMQNTADGSVRWFKTGLHTNEIATLEGNLYLQLFATINNDASLKSILAGSTASADQGISGELLGVADKQNLIKLLATHGRTWYKKLFVIGADSDLTTMMAQWRGYSRTDRAIRLRIESDGIYLPWQLIIPPGTAEPKAEDFWGFRYELSVLPTGINLPDRLPGPLQYVGGHTLYGQYQSANQNDVVSQLAGEELNYLQDTLGISGIVTAKRGDTFRDALTNYRDDLKVILTFTHGANTTVINSDGQLTQDAAGPRLIFADNEYLRVSVISELVSATPADEKSFFPAGPVIFLNGCETGTAGFYSTTNEDFAGTFLSMGSRGVIVTEAPIWTFFGYSFGQDLLRELTTGEPITEAILKTRIRYLQNANNPLGLLYSYYGGADVAVHF